MTANYYMPLHTPKLGKKPTKVPMTHCYLPPAFGNDSVNIPSFLH